MNISTIVSMMLLFVIAYLGLICFMNISLFDLFKVSVGPSSSHYFAPMLAGAQFIREAAYQDLLHSSEEITIEFFGSLALAGKTQRADNACVIGLMGISPQDIGDDQINLLIADIKKNRALKLNNQRHIQFDWKKNIIFHSNQNFEEYSNGLEISIKDHKGNKLKNKIYYSTGGGYIVEKDLPESNKKNPLPHHFSSMSELRKLCKENQKSIAELVFTNEVALLNSEANKFDFNDLCQRIDQLWQAIKSSLKRGVQFHGSLPGGLNVNRRAPYLHEMIKLRVAQNKKIENDDWVNLFAIAMCEENAVGGKIVSAPSHGSAGVIAATLSYYNKFISNEDAQGIRNFIATSAAIGSLYKNYNSINSPQLGCQGEIGVACSMAAAGLTAAQGGNLDQIENAAKIGMEHNIGLTCDPVGGLVQVPCIERNCMGAIKAINASRLAMTTEYQDPKDLDDMIINMHQIGLNMRDQFKETSLGDASKNLISVNIVYC